MRRAPPRLHGMELENSWRRGSDAPRLPSRKISSDIFNANARNQSENVHAANLEKTVGVGRWSTVAPWHGIDARDRCHDGAYLMGYHPHHMPYLAADPRTPAFLWFLRGQPHIPTLYVLCVHVPRGGGLIGGFTVPSSDRHPSNSPSFAMATLASLWILQCSTSTYLPPTHTQLTGHYLFFYLK